MLPIINNIRKYGSLWSGGLLSCSLCKQLFGIKCGLGSVQGLFCSCQTFEGFEEKDVRGSSSGKSAQLYFKMVPLMSSCHSSLPWLMSRPTQNLNPIEILHREKGCFLWSQGGSEEKGVKQGDPFNPFPIRQNWKWLVAFPSQIPNIFSCLLPYTWSIIIGFLLEDI